MRLGSGVLAFLVLVLCSCQTIAPPLEEYVLARTAIYYANISGGGQASPGNWHKADSFFRKAERLYNLKEYEAAKSNFIQARIHAERAENLGKIKTVSDGGSVD